MVTGRLKGSPRVLPILEFHLPEASANEFPWYIMPKAETLRDVLEGVGWRKMLSVFIELADGLAELHTLGVAHRDVKPENVFRFEGAYCFGDFGIAAFPERKGLTKEDEPMGPATFLAPEMESNTSEADAYPADVYSLAKSLWVMLGGKKFAFPGQYSSTGSERLSTLAQATDFFLEPLEALLIAATSSDPSSRPAAADFSAKLKTIAELQYDFDKANPQQWEFANRAALQRAGVARAEWRDVKAIAEVVGMLSKHRGMNHCFYPEGGGMHVESAYPHEGGQMLALRLAAGMGTCVLKPIRLILECFPDHPEYGYAVLEAGEAERLTQGNSYLEGPIEHLKMLNEFEYVVNDSHEDYSKFYNVGEPCERRFMGGLFVIAPTGGIYNRIDDYMGTAEKLGIEGLRNEFARLLESTQDKHAESRRLEPFVRLQSQASSRVDFTLIHLSKKLLWALIDLDDERVEQRKQRSDGIGYARDAAAIIAFAASDPLRVKSQAFLKELTNDQQGEYMALIEVGRGNCTPAEFHECVEQFANLKQEVGYLDGKLGNGYLRKAIKRFGLAIVEPASMA
ncbi:Serine/threonine-protein kinase PknK [Andreprevotia sp. IGB-42]|nr:Serine/threonine-protein kinase PknK [Andreprevotia sp. IGB-42]